MRPLTFLALGLLLGLGAATAERSARAQSKPTELLMAVSGPFVDPGTSTPIILLSETSGERRQLPIWIGTGQARSIALALQNRESPRPNTHDLLVTMLDELSANVVRVVVTELRQTTYHARIVLRTAAGERSVDARPSDAIAIAVRVGAPVFAREALLEEQPKSDARPPTQSPAEPEA